MASSSQKLRILALPLMRSSKAPMIYFYSINPPTSANNQPSYLNRATSWAGKQWDKLGAAEVDSWKHKAWRRGEKL